MTTALEEGEWSAARPGRTLPPGKTVYPFYRRVKKKKILCIICLRVKPFISINKEISLVFT